MHELESRLESPHPTSVDCAVFDAMFVVQSLGVIPATYGGIANLILSRILIADRVDFVCDTYTDTPTIKDVERADRGAPASSIEYVITGSEQNIPK